MKMKRLLAVAFALILVASFKTAFAQNRGPSTPDERKRAVEIATLLENDPLNKDEKALSRELLIWLIEVPDIHVKICTNVFGDYSKIKGDYAPTVTAQATFSEAKFIIEHPEQASDEYQVYLAGVEGVLKTYVNIKKAKPKVKMEALELLLVKQQSGQLADFVKTAMSGCKGGK
ncbi:MAG: hypothetical protein QOF72_1499 [Blastocatellia bacterium]|jgi:hypothetical protein|nr:hypothetical protein [Blastocatellia bacterium]